MKEHRWAFTPSIHGDRTVHNVVAWLGSNFDAYTWDWEPSRLDVRFVIVYFDNQADCNWCALRWV